MSDKANLIRSDLFELKKVDNVVKQVLTELFASMPKDDSNVSKQSVSCVWNSLGAFGSLLKHVIKIIY